MKLSQLRTQFRSDADDVVANPYLFADADVTMWLNEAETEAALRADLLHDSTTADVCEIAVVAGTSAYSLHAAVNRVTYATFTITDASCPTVLRLIDRIELDRIRPDWRTLQQPPEHLIVEAGKARLGCIPSDDGVLAIECYRAPLVAMAADDDVPEIMPASLHRHLVQWALHRAYSRPDTETYDAGRAKAALQEFEHFFGPRPDAAMKQAFEARPQFNKAWW